MFLDLNLNNFVDGLSYLDLKDIRRLSEDRLKFLDSCEVSDDILELVKSGEFIRAIKAIREHSGLNLRDAKTIVDYLRFKDCKRNELDP